VPAPRVDSIGKMPIVRRRLPVTILLSASQEHEAKHFLVMNPYFCIIAFYMFGLIVQKNTTPNLECTLLEKASLSEAFAREFFICKSNNDTFKIYDKVFFTRGACAFKSVCEKNMEVLEGKPLQETLPENIILYRVDKKFKRWKLYFWRPYSGAVVMLTYKRRINGIKLISSEIGSF
jgi:hypothetical protein